MQTAGFVIWPWLKFGELSITYQLYLETLFQWWDGIIQYYYKGLTEREYLIIMWIFVLALRGWLCQGCLILYYVLENGRRYSWVSCFNNKDDIWFCNYQSLLYLVTEGSIFVGFTIQILSWLAIKCPTEFTLFRFMRP